MPKKLTRTLKLAVIGDEIVSSDQLVASSERYWNTLRQYITDQWHGRPRRVAAKCIKCEGPVFISVHGSTAGKLPLFKHYNRGDPSCPWYTGDTARPDAIRAEKYGGNQESPEHRFLCEEIAREGASDERCAEPPVVSLYLPPSEGNAYGRYPDVLLAFKDGQRFVFEVQRATTFQTEISARGLHYGREGIPIIWLLWEVDLSDGTLQQSFRDVILRHRDNAFVIDLESIAAAKERKTVVLKCYLRNRYGKFDKGRLVTLDDLTYPEVGLPYYRDQVVAPRVEQAHEARQIWWQVFRARPEPSGYSDFRAPDFTKAFEDLCARLPVLKARASQNPEFKSEICHFLAFVFSLITHAEGNFRNFISAQNVVAMLNSKVGKHDMLQYLPMVAALISRTPAASLLAGTVGDHLRRAKTKLQETGKVLNITQN